MPFNCRKYMHYLPQGKNFLMMHVYTVHGIKSCEA
uniref:Uncharacterized protein n=1 Tax=Anguilla anguilla TaxID=7936 RepID=A0A0E9VES7_ANGAN